MMAETIKKSDGLFVLMCFVAFFALIVCVNSVFIYMALKTHSGVVTEDPYEKGLAFNETLEKAKAQPDLGDKVSYEAGVLHWKLPITGASVKASLIRSVRDGHDFDIALTHLGDGVYEARPEMPLPGAWTAKLKATWNNKEFQTSHDFMAQ